MHDNLIKKALEENDRRGERAIAFFQGFIAIIVFVFHIVSAWRNNWEPFSNFTIFVAVTILIACVWRIKLSKSQKLNNLALHILSVIDGILIFILIASYSFAYALPIETSLKAPSLIFLILYTTVRVMKFDPIPILVAGSTVLTGWIFLLLLVTMGDANITQSYAEFLSTEKILIGAAIEMAVGYAAVIMVLTIATYSARRFIENSAHKDELAYANATIEDNLSSLESIISSSIDGILIVNKDGMIERTNPAIEKMFGFSKDELIGAHTSMLMSEKNADLLKEAVDGYLSEGKNPLIGNRFESVAIHKNKTYFPIDLSINEFHAGDKVCFAGFIRDISDKKTLEAKEGLANLRFEESVKVALDGIIIINEQDEIVLFNPAAEEIFGYTFDEIKGKSMADYIVPKKHRASHHAGMKHYSKTGEGPVLNNRIEIEGLHKNGNIFDLELAIKDIDGPDGKLFIGYARDITSRKQSEKDLIAAKERAEVATKAKASFLAMMSHEIRTPLNGVIGTLSLLDDGTLNKQQKKLIKTAKRSGRSLLNITNDVLTFSKLEAGKLELEQITFMIDPLVDSVFSLLKSKADQKEIDLSYTIEKNIPNVLFGDLDRIRQILLNLAGNSVKFTESGYVKIKVENKGTKRSPRIRFSIEDTGIGIPKDKHNLIFSEFSTVDASNARKFGGTGLGLAISKELVSAMKGDIQFKSVEGKGSTFWFEIPIQKGNEAQIDEPVQDTDIKLSKREQETKILIAEDNATNQMIVSIMLERLGCSFEIASDGVEAVNAVQNADFDLILMDVSMPRMDGIEATKAIRNLKGKKSKVKIVALTAYAFEEDKQRVIEAGMNDFIPKPLSKADLVRVISQKNISKATRSKSPLELEKSLSFDPGTLMPIIDGLDKEARNMLLSQIQDDISKYEKALKKSAKETDIEQLERASHGLKGLAGTFGADELQHIAENINNKCRNNEIEPTNNAIKEVLKISAKVKTSIKDLTNSLDSKDE